MKKNPSFVVIGGGTGTFSILSGLKQYTENITAIVTMADSGGSAKKERDEWGLLPSSDIRKSLIALADVSDQDNLLLRHLFQYRYQEGRGVSGMTFGNLFLIALTKLLGSQTEAIEKASEFLRIRGKVLPVSLDSIDLIAEYEDGSKIVGEHAIDEPKHDGKLRITKLTTYPKATMTEHARQAIEKADVIIIGPGGFYTTILANLVINGVVEAIKKSRAKKIFILNLMTEYGQTYRFTASTFLSRLDRYLPVSLLDYVFLNDAPIPSDILSRYRKHHTEPIINDLPRGTPYRVVAKDLLSSAQIKREKGDKLQRSLVRHDPEKIAGLCMRVLGLV